MEQINVFFWCSIMVAMSVVSGKILFYSIKITIHPIFIFKQMESNFLKLFTVIILQHLKADLNLQYILDKIWFVDYTLSYRRHKKPARIVSRHFLCEIMDISWKCFITWVFNDLQKVYLITPKKLFQFNYFEYNIFFEDNI